MEEYSAPREAQTHDPDIKGLMLYPLSYLLEPSNKNLLEPSALHVLMKDNFFPPEYWGKRTQFTPSRL